MAYPNPLHNIILGKTVMMSTVGPQRKRLQAYLSLVQKLLLCPHGEEWIHLKEHEDLLDAKFVQVLEQVAAQLFREGDRQSAKYLYNWAAKLHHILDNPSADSETEQNPEYVDLIQELLNCPEEMVGDLLACHEELIGPELVTIMHTIAKKIMAQGLPEKAQFLEKLANHLSHKWIQAHLVLPRSPSPETDTLEEETPHLEKHSLSPRTTPKAEMDSDEGAEAKPPQGKLNKDTPSALPTLQKGKPEAFPDPWQSDAPLSSALQLKVPQQIANGLTEVALLLHEMDKTLGAQTQAIQALTTQLKQQDRGATARDSGGSGDPLWYMEVLERACDRAWVLTTEEVEKLIGVKPIAQGNSSLYERGCWRFEKVGKLGAQTAWRVHKS